MQKASIRCSVAALAVFAWLILIPSGEVFAQKHPPSFREFLLQYKGKDIQISDNTGGSEQFTTGDPAKAYTLTLNDVQNDYIVVTRTTPTDKRSFVYPISFIRRVIFLFDGKPYEKILLEMY